MEVEGQVKVYQGCPVNKAEKSGHAAGRRESPFGLDFWKSRNAGLDVGQI